MTNNERGTSARDEVRGGRFAGGAACGFSKLKLNLIHIFRVLAGGTAMAIFAGCGGSVRDEGPADAITRVVLQTDWHPQPEHGGFYQAAEKGFYEDRGLEVQIAPGGPNAMVLQRVSRGMAHFGIWRSDDLIVARSRGMPVVAVAAFMDRDPQALLMRAGSPVESFEDLNGRTIMASPGSAWVQYLRRTFGIDFNLLPLSYGLGQFLADPELIQQCFITSEPYYVQLQGVKPKTLLIADSGYEPYRVIFTSDEFIRDHPDVVRDFVSASLRGWVDYMEGNPAPGNAGIASVRSDGQMTPDFMDYSINAMKDHGLVKTVRGEDERVGGFDRDRIVRLIDVLDGIGLLERAVAVDEVFSWDFLPEYGW